MANPNPFAPPPMFNGQYVPQPPYHYYHGPPQTPNGPAPYPQGIQHNPAFAAQASNARRFEANSNTSTPPPPLPFLFPPHTDFEGLRKHIEAHGLPPPPPPPPGQAFPSTLTPSPHPAAAPTHTQQPPIPHFAQARPPFPSIPSPAISQSPSFRTHNGYTTPSRQGNAQDARAVHHVSAPTIANVDGTTLSGIFQQNSLPESTNNDPSTQWNQAAASQNAIPESVQKEPEPEPSRGEKHTKARAAISDFVSAGITFQNLVDEGIKPPVLNQLFDELGIGRDAPSLAVKRPVQESAPQPQPIAPTATLQQPPDNRQPTTTPQPAVLDPAMERKDRIAQLLAMKKGHAVASAKSSQSASPAPVDTSPRPALKPAPSPARVSPRQPLQQLVVDTVKVDAAETPPSTALQPQSNNATVDSLNSLSTPVREAMEQQGFSIPGLFLTSADETDQPEPAPAQLTSLKRRAEPVADIVMPQAKRQVSHVAERSQELDSTSGSGTAISAEIPPSSPLSVKNPEQNELPTASDSDRATENGPQPSRPKINQDKLKNRMAALKADLMRKNTRKQALQDGMPVLDAEVEKTRERLLEQQTRLSIVRKDVEVKTAELAQAREEEGNILHEIQRLERHLADGESGQQQFSNELTQLNDQIVADEKESRSSPQATVRSSPQAEAPEPQPHTSNQDVQMEVEIEVVPTTESLNGHGEQQVATGPPSQGAEANLRVPSYDLQQTETEYSPEQEDLDRQLNFQMATSAAQDQENVDARQTTFDHEAAIAQQELLNEPSLQTQNSTTATPSEDQSGDESDDDRMSIDEASGAESDASVSMSNGSDDYEPAAEVQQAQPISMDDNDEYDPEDAAQYQPPLEAENDDYEPAEEVDVLNVDALNGLRRESEIPGPSLPEQVLDEDSNHHTARPPSLAGIAVTGSAVSDRLVADDVELPLTSGPTTDDERLPLQQPTQPSSGLLQPTSDVIESKHVDTFPEEETPAVPRFKPYESPLSTLKSYRFHPQFNQLVKNGYRSLTYSNRIDAGNPICATELEGQMCMDVKCSEQHFGGMGLSDDKILVQMSSANDYKDKDQRDAYLLGLKKVIADLREQGVKEFSEVANALSKYRREWTTAQDGLVT